MTNLMQGLSIVGVGIAGVFVNLFALMLVMKIIGNLFGEKKKKELPKEQKS